MFTATLFTGAKTWKQPKCPSAHEWVKKRNTVEHCSAMKEKNSAICSNMDTARDYHTKRSKSERERQILYDVESQVV